MPELKVTVLVEQDGSPVSGFPLVRRVVCDQVAAWNPYFQGASAPSTFTAVPASTVAVLQALILRPDGTVLVRFANQTDAGLQIDPDGLLIVLGCSVDETAALNATVYADADTNIRGLAAGATQ